MSARADCACSASELDRPDTLAKWVTACSANGNASRYRPANLSSAARVAAELKDKAGAMFLGSLGAAKQGAAQPSPAEAMGKAANEAISALVNLGYRQAEAFGAVAQAAQALGQRATLDALIKAGLRELSAR